MPAFLITIILNLLTNTLSGQPDPVVKVIIALAEKLLQAVDMSDVNSLVSSLKEGYGEQWVNNLFKNLQIKSNMSNEEVTEIFNKIQATS
jgi:hypothetical protein